MAFCLAELHLWSTKSSLQVKDTDIGTHQYYDKGEPDLSLERHHYNEKQQFCEARGYSWTPKNRHQEKLHHSLKELEQLQETHACVQVRWRNKHCCQVMLSSGVLLTLTLNGPQLEHIWIDRWLVGRLPANTVTDAVLSDRLVLLSFLEQSQVTAVYLKRNQESPEMGRHTDKLNIAEIKSVCVELDARQVHRRVALNRPQDLALCWWNNEEATEEELKPWTSTDSQRNNLILISCSSSEGLKVVSSVRTNGNLLDCGFSLLQPRHVLTVEIPSASQDGSSIDSCVYECSGGRLFRLSTARISLSSRPVSCSRGPSENFLLLGLSDSWLVLLDQRRGVSLRACCPLLPALLSWHPSGAAVMVGGRDQLMCFDVGLAPVGLTLVSEEVASDDTLRLSQHLCCSGGLEGMWWRGLDGRPEETDVLTLAFQGGPMGALKFRLGLLTGGRLSLEDLLQQRLRCSQAREAVGILESLDWNVTGKECFRGLSSICNHLLRLELNAEREALLEAALAVFYAPPTPLSDAAVLEFSEPVKKYGRRFFHHLLRHQRFEKAFLLAVDLQDRDLFMDLHYAACDKGEVVLANVAKRKANEITRNADAVGRNEAFVSIINDRQTERSHSAPLLPESSATNARQANQRRAETVQMNISPDVLRNRRQTTAGQRGGGRDGGSDGDPGMLHVAHLGTI